MKKHVKAFTYAPKIPAVRSGECRQTIRTGDKVSVGDEILWHGWTSVPYRSPWSWRLRVTITDVTPIVVDHERGIRCYEAYYNAFHWYAWFGMYTGYLARMDFIDPPTGFALRDVLEEMNGKMDCVECQIIRW